MVQQRRKHIIVWLITFPHVLLFRMFSEMSIRKSLFKFLYLSAFASSAPFIN